jgi:hypothetical protein
MWPIPRSLPTANFRALLADLTVRAGGLGGAGGKDGGGEVRTGGGGGDAGVDGGVRVTGGTAVVGAAPVNIVPRMLVVRVVVLQPAVPGPAVLVLAVLVLAVRPLVVLGLAVLAVPLDGALPSLGGDTTSTLSVGISPVTALADSAPPQAMQAPLCRVFTVPQLGHFQVLVGMGQSDPVWVEPVRG